MSKNLPYTTLLTTTKPFKLISSTDTRWIGHFLPLFEPIKTSYFFDEKLVKNGKNGIFKKFEKIEIFSIFWVPHIVPHIFCTFPAYCPAITQTSLNIWHCPLSFFSLTCHVLPESVIKSTLNQLNPFIVTISTKIFIRFWQRWISVDKSIISLKKWNA